MKKNTRKLAKEKTKAELLAASSRILKKKGMANTSVDQVMSEANLTRGSFYSYFKSKDDMILQSLAWMVNQSHQKIAGQLQTMKVPREKSFEAFIQFYLSPLHRDSIEEGCPIAALSRDISISSKKFKQDFAKVLSQTIEHRRNLLPVRGEILERKKWIGVLSTYVGALVLSRACAGENLSEEILSSAFDFIQNKKEIL